MWAVLISTNQEHDSFLRTFLYLWFKPSLIELRQHDNKVINNSDLTQDSNWSASMKKRKPNHKEKRKEDQNKTDKIEQEHRP
jgi:hypothetical protein